VFFFFFFSDLALSRETTLGVARFPPWGLCFGHLKGLCPTSALKWNVALRNSVPRMDALLDSEVTWLVLPMTLLPSLTRWGLGFPELHPLLVLNYYMPGDALED